VVLPLLSSTLFYLVPQSESKQFVLSCFAEQQKFIINTLAYYVLELVITSRFVFPEQMLSSFAGATPRTQLQKVFVRIFNLFFVLNKMTKELSACQS
jgi:hypothetical protein